MRVSFLSFSKLIITNNAIRQLRFSLSIKIKRGLIPCLENPTQFEEGPSDGSLRAAFAQVARRTTHELRERLFTTPYWVRASHLLSENGTPLS